MGVQYALDMNVLDSENEKQAILIRLDPIMISVGTSCGENPESVIGVKYIYFKLVYNRHLIPSFA
jgi:hypothetical protein